MAILQKTSIYLLLLSLLTIGCKKDNDDIQQTDIEIPIVSELPVMYYGCYLTNGQNVVVEDQIGFDTVFNQNIVSPVPSLQNFDFSKYNILAGAEVYTHGVFKLEHSFIMSPNSEYIYTVKVYYDLTHQAGIFYYGVVIDKLPSNAIIKFEVIKFNE